MTEPKWTPGPWYPGHLGNPDIECECRSVCDEGFAGGIATVHVNNGIALIGEGGNDCPPHEQAVANMHLIAAAPALYAALEAAIKIADEAREEWDKAPAGMRAGKILIALSGGCPRYRADIDQIHAALRAARGEPEDG